MSLTMGSLILAETRIQGVTLRPVLGAYELLFGLKSTVHPENESARRASIIGARVTVKVSDGSVHQLGFARPDAPFEIVPTASQYSMTPALSLTLQPAQLAAIEERRGTGDLDFELLATGHGRDGKYEQSVQDSWGVHVPRSDWIKKLRNAKARDILLLEVSMPIGTRSKKWVEIEKGLKRAEEHFFNGEYLACVSSCRGVLQELGYQKLKEKDWAGPLLSRLASNRNEMTKDDREAAFWGTLRHYTHQAHHSESEGGETAYSRADAKLVLTLTAAFVARVMGG